ncbi:tyrosine-type recombinase/integrase [Vallitalea okinawensis]|uniref:tyrosine-type recombinase/integrase n=1 Tax=Vallitalea okinawensis TaxID=2078660 RepID=UPI000CFD660A|nr:tyrosine-type recombinase/integrase [Vallitalea okinawensis]
MDNIELYDKLNNISNLKQDNDTNNGIYSNYNSLHTDNSIYGLNNSVSSFKVSSTNKYDDSDIIYNNSNNNDIILNNSISNDDMLIELFLLERAESSRKVYYRVIGEFKKSVKETNNVNHLNEVTIVHVSEYKQRLLTYRKKDGKPLSLATVSQRLNIISGLFTFAKDVGYLQYNPVKAIKKPKYDNRNEHKFLTEQDTTLLLKSLKQSSQDSTISDRNFLIGAILLYTGLRISELCSLSWCDFYLDPRNRIGIKVKGKGSKWRNIKIRKELWFYISMYRRKCGKSDEFDIEDTSPLFYNRYDERLSQWGVRKMLSKACEQVGLSKKVTPHWFRHTSASMALANGADIKKVMTQFGWSSLVTPQRYLHDISGFDDAATDYVNVQLD